MSEIILSDLNPRNYLSGEVGEVIINDKGELKVQPLSFDGTEPVANGNPEDFVLKSFHITGTEPVINGSGSMEFYKCASVTTPEQCYIVSGAGTTSCNGTYLKTNQSYNGQSIYSFTNNDTTYYLGYFSENEAWFIIDIASSEWTDSDVIYNNALYVQDYIYDGQIDDYVKGWIPVNGDESAPTVTLSSTNSEKKWTGYKATLSNGVYTFANNITSNLDYSVVTPVVNKIYTNGALIEANLWTGVPQPDLYFPLNNTIESITNTNLTNSNVTFDSNYAIFNGNSYLEMPSSIYSMFNQLSSIFTCMWFKYNDYEETETACWAVGTGNTDFGVWPNESGINGPTLNFKNNSGWDSNGNGITKQGYPDNNWHFVGYYSKSNGIQYAYMDGDFKINSNASEFISSSKSAGRIGSRENGSFSFQGNIAQLRFLFNKELDASTFQSYCSIYMNMFTPSND